MTDLIGFCVSCGYEDYLQRFPTPPEEESKWAVEVCPECGSTKIEVFVEGDER